MLNVCQMVKNVNINQSLSGEFSHIFKNKIVHESSSRRYCTGTENNVMEMDAAVRPGQVFIVVQLKQKSVNRFQLVSVIHVKFRQISIWAKKYKEHNRIQL